jgi:uncharacterized membrane protein YfcA
VLEDGIVKKKPKKHMAAMAIMTIIAISSVIGAYRHYQNAKIIHPESFGNCAVR